MPNVKTALFLLERAFANALYISLEILLSVGSWEEKESLANEKNSVLGGINSK